MLASLEQPTEGNHPRPETGLHTTKQVSAGRWSCRKSVHNPRPWAEVALTVYELPGFHGFMVNALAKAAGMVGAYHVGIEVYWLEWSFGACDQGTGVFPDFVGESHIGNFQQRISLGQTPCSPPEVIEILEELRNTWHGNSYDWLLRNCGHFSAEFAKRLRVQHVPDMFLTPAWVRSAAPKGVHPFCAFSALSLPEGVKLELRNKLWAKAKSFILDRAKEELELATSASEEVANRLRASEEFHRVWEEMYGGKLKATVVKRKQIEPDVDVMKRSLSVDSWTTLRSQATNRNWSSDPIVWL